MAENFAKKGWHFAQKRQALGSRVRPGTNSPPHGTRSYSTLTASRTLPWPIKTEVIPPRNWYSNRADDKSLMALMTGDTESFPPRLRAIREDLAVFMAEHVFPNEKKVADHQLSPERWTPLPLIEKLKVSCHSWYVYYMFNADHATSRMRYVIQSADCAVP